MSRKILLIITALAAALLIGCESGGDGDSGSGGSGNGGAGNGGDPGNNPPAYELFAAKDGEHGNELWRTDGTEKGTYLVKDINSGNGDSKPAGFICLNGKYYFSSDDGRNGRELWVSDGTESGTHLLKDINTEPYATSEQPIAPGDGISRNDKFHIAAERIFFNAYRIKEGKRIPSIFISDGTEAGTQPVADKLNIADISILNGKIYLLYVKTSADDGLKLGIYDNVSGITPVKVAEGINVRIELQCFVQSDGKICFFGEAGDWTNPEFNLNFFDGTDLTSVKLQTASGEKIIPFELFGAVEGRVVFVGRTGPRDNETCSLYSADINGKLESLDGWDSHWSYFMGYGSMNGKIYISTSKGFVITDGTAANTITKTSEYNYSLAGPGGKKLLCWNGKFYLGRSKYDGSEKFFLCMFDGTEIKPVSEKADFPDQLHVFGNRLIFSGKDGTNGWEVWSSDGTDAGTSLVKDIYKGAESSDPWWGIE